MIVQYLKSYHHPMYGGLLFHHHQWVEAAQETWPGYLDPLCHPRISCPKVQPTRHLEGIYQPQRVALGNSWGSLNGRV